MSVPWYDEVTWSQPEALATDFYAIRVRADRSLDDAQARQLFGLIGYAFRQHFRGEPLGEPQRISDREWAVHYDITKSASDDWLWRLNDALAAARTYAAEGTPPRKTNRGGPVGSRLVEGLGPISLEFWLG